MAGAFNFLPILAKIFPNWSGYNQSMKILSSASDVIGDVIKRHQASQADGEPRDFLDVYFREILNEKDPHSSFFGEVGGKDRTISKC